MTLKTILVSNYKRQCKELTVGEVSSFSAVAEGEVQLCTGIFGKASKETAAILHPASSMDEFLCVLFR